MMQVTETTKREGRLYTQAVKVEYKTEDVLPIEAKKKVEIRQAIDGQVGDIYDLLADANKRLGMLERLVMRFIADSWSIVAIDPIKKAEYSAMLTAYLGAVEAGVAQDRSDLEDSSALFQKLMSRTTQIAEIVKNA